MKLRVKLLRLYIDSGRVNEAYTHATEVEKKSPYPQSVEWYQCLLDVFQVSWFYRRYIIICDCSMGSASLMCAYSRSNPIKD